MRDGVVIHAYLQPFLPGLDGSNVARHAATDDDEIFLLFARISSALSLPYWSFTNQLESHSLSSALPSLATRTSSAKYQVSNLSLRIVELF